MQGFKELKKFVKRVEKKLLKILTKWQNLARIILITTAVLTDGQKLGLTDANATMKW